MKNGRWLVGLAVGFYATFVLQNLWNWFLVPAVNVRPISYWLMFGLNLLVKTVITPDTFPVLVQHASLGDEEKRRVEETLTDAKMWTEVSLPLLLGNLFNLTWALAIGWAIRVFLM